MNRAQSWFRLGRAVCAHIKTDSLLRPSQAELKAVAEKLEISVADAKVALGFYNFGSVDTPPAKPAPTVNIP